jgi:hypothetical protein
MKKRVFLSTIILASLVCIAFTSCSDDDGNEGGSSSSGQIVGTWEIDLEHTPSISIEINPNGSTLPTHNKPKLCSHIQFLKDGTCIKVYHLDPEDLDNNRKENLEIDFCKYKTSGKSITFFDDNLEQAAEYDVLGSKLYLAYIKDDTRVEYAYSQVDEKEMEEYYAKDNMDYLSSLSVDLEKYLTDVDFLERYKVDMSQYEVEIADKKVNLTPSIPKFSCPDNRHPHAIDMGGAAGKWACCNVEAGNPAESGGYYAWGETDQRNYYTKMSYKHFRTTKGFIDIGNDISGTYNDVAHMKWGGDWKMPSNDRINALLANCTFQWTEFKMYGNADTDNCYRINGNIYRLDKIDNDENCYVIGDKLYQLDEFFRFGRYYLILGDFYNISSISNYYLINGKFYNIPYAIAKRCYVIGNKVYDISNPEDIYEKGNELYFINASIIKGIKGLRAEPLENSKYALENMNVEQLAYRLSTLKLVNDVSGLVLTSNNKKSIFFPAAGECFKEQPGQGAVGLLGKYWSSNHYASGIAYAIYLDKNGINIVNGEVIEGYPVRPVAPY